MGKFTHSTVIVGATAQALAVFYRAKGTKAFIFQDERSICAICDDNDDEADLDLIEEVTAEFQTIALLCQVFDSTVFVGTIFNRGIAIDEYIDYPDHPEYLSGLGV